MQSYQATYQTVVTALDTSLIELGRTLAPPVMTETLAGSGYRYVQKSPEQALMLKCVRLLSGLKALKILLDNGLLLDAGAMMRIIDEVLSDIMFIAGPTLFQHEQEPRHVQYMAEFFQEEFDNADPCLSQQKRNRVSRKHIRAYVARTYSGSQGNVSKAISVTEIVDAAFSGFIHGASVHIMEAFDGEEFKIGSDGTHPPLLAVSDQFSHYLQRAIQGFCFAAMGMRQPEIFHDLYQKDGELFKSDGELISSDYQE